MDICIICLSGKNIVTYKECCKVFVHKICIDEWNKQNDYKCIICRKSDLNYYDRPVEFNIIIEYNSNKFILVCITIFMMMMIIVIC